MKNKLMIIGLISLILIMNYSTAFAETNSSIPQNDTISLKNQPDSKKHAVIMVGRYFGLLNQMINRDIIQNYYTNYLKDAGKMYTTLRDTCGFFEDNIHLLVKELPGFNIPDEFNTEWIDYSSSEENLEMVLDDLDHLNSEDSLFICIIGHGGIYGNGGINWKTPDEHAENSLWINNENAYDDDKKTCAKFKQGINGDSQSLCLTLTQPTNIKGFRIKAKNDQYIDEMNIHFVNNGHFIDKGEITFENWKNNNWEYYRFNECTADEVKIHFHENHPVFRFKEIPAEVYEFDFWPASEPDDITDTFFGTPLDSIPDVWKYLFGNEVDKLYDYELANYVSDINTNMIFILQPCNSGGFINDLSGKNRVILTSAYGYEFAESWLSTIQEAFNRDNFIGEHYKTKNSNADYNKDGDISILEAYRVASNYVHHWYGEAQHPLIEDDNNDIGSHYYEEDFNPETNLPNGLDGFIADDITLGVRTAPFKPDKPSGPKKINKEKSYNYTTFTTDPNGYNLYYWFDWGDGSNSGWIGPRTSGEAITVAHNWTEKGSFNIKVKTKNINDIEGPWSESYIISVEKSKAKSKTIHNFLQLFPRLQNIINYIKTSIYG